MLCVCLDLLKNYAKFRTNICYLREKTVVNNLKVLLKVHDLSSFSMYFIIIAIIKNTHWNLPKSFTTKQWYTKYSKTISFNYFLYFSLHLIILFNSLRIPRLINPFTFLHVSRLTIHFTSLRVSHLTTPFCSLSYFTFEYAVYFSSYFTLNHSFYFC